jgi:hypothetical protein
MTFTKSVLLGATALSLTLGLGSTSIAAGINGGMKVTKGGTHVLPPAGTKVKVLDAVVNSDGSLARGAHATGSIGFGSGNFEVDFDRDVTQCAYIATIGQAASGTAPPGFITDAARAGNPDGVFVKTRDSSGANVAIQFHLVVACPKI